MQPEARRTDMKKRLLIVAVIASSLAGAIAPAAQAEDAEYIPGYTDFPNHLRFDSEYDRARFQSGLYGGVITVRRVSPGFDWTDAGIGAGGATVVLLLGTGLAALALRRPHRGVALSG
jgi:hypothetical protein